MNLPPCPPSIRKLIQTLKFKIFFFQNSKGISFQCHVLHNFSILKDVCGEDVYPGTLKIIPHGGHLLYSPGPCSMAEMSAMDLQTQVGCVPLYFGTIQDTKAIIMITKILAGVKLPMFFGSPLRVLVEGKGKCVVEVSEGNIQVTAAYFKDCFDSSSIILCIDNLGEL